MFCIRDLILVLRCQKFEDSTKAKVWLFLESENADLLQQQKFINV